MAGRVVHGLRSAPQAWLLPNTGGPSAQIADCVLGLCPFSAGQTVLSYVSRYQFHVESASLTSKSETPRGGRRVHPLGGWVDL